MPAKADKRGQKCGKVAMRTALREEAFVDEHACRHREIGAVHHRRHWVRH